MNIEELKNLRQYYYNMKKEADNNKNIDDYIKFNKLYNNMSSKIHHFNNKDNEEYKNKKYETLKRCLKNNPEYYERIKEKNRIRNNDKYICTKKDLKNKIYDNNE